MKKTLDDKESSLLKNITYFLPHLSSQYFASRIDERTGIDGREYSVIKMVYKFVVGRKCWCSFTVPDAGGVVPFRKVKRGDKLLMGIPESARFNYAYALLTVV